MYDGLRTTYSNQLTALDATLGNTNVLIGQAGLTTKSLTEQHIASRGSSSTTVASGR